MNVYLNQYNDYQYTSTLLYPFHAFCFFCVDTWVIGINGCATEDDRDTAQDKKECFVHGAKR